MNDDDCQYTKDNRPVIWHIFTRKGLFRNILKKWLNVGKQQYVYFKKIQMRGG